MEATVTTTAMSESFRLGLATHSFNVSLATLIGLNETIILTNFYFNVKSNEGNENMIKDGRVWFFRSVKYLNEQYPYLTPDKIRRAIERLINAGYVIKGDYNQDKFNKCNWYSISDEVYILFEGINAESIGQNAKPFGIMPSHSAKCQLDYKQEDYKQENIYNKKETPYINIGGKEKSKNGEHFCNAQTRFVPPSIKDVEEYCREKGYNIDALSFVSFYASKDWMIGRNRMKDWKKAIVTWVQREKKDGKYVEKPKSIYADCLR